MDSVLTVGLLLAAKHFIADGVLQRPYQYLNKGKLTHPGGWLHAGIHCLFTAAILVFVTEYWALIAVTEMLAHFAIDWTKVNLTKRCGWSEMLPAGYLTCPPPPARYFENKTQKPHLAIYSDYYFWALVADQSLHFACYAVIIWLVR